MTSRRSYQGNNQNMYGARSSRPVEARDGIPLAHLSMMPRRQNVYGGADDSHNSRGSRGKAIADEDVRLGGSSSRGDVRVSSFLGGGGKTRGSNEHADHHRSDDTNPYGTVSERRAFRDEGLLKVARGVDDAPLRVEGSGRFRDGSSSRGERVVRSSAAYADDAKWIRNGNYDSLNYDADGVGSLRDSDYLPIAKPTTVGSSSSAVLPGFIFECHKRTILDFSSQKGSFILPFDDRRLAEQAGPGTKIFMFDSNARELHGVFQAESFATIDIDANTLRVSDGTPVKVRVRVAKECIPLTERQFKEILHDNYYTSSKFAESLTKEQVMKLLHTFRPVDPARNVHISLPSSRHTLDSSLSHSNQYVHSISDEIVYRKEERWRRGTVDTRSLSGNSFHVQDARFSSKLPAQTLSAKVLDDYEDYGDDDLIEDLPLSTSRLLTGVNTYSASRGKQHLLRNLSGSRPDASLAGGVVLPEVKLTDADWREDFDRRDLLYRKRQPLSPSPLEDLKRGGRSPSPPWKDLHRIETGVAEMYDRPGKGVYKEDPSYLSTRRRRHNDIDLNISLEMGHGEPARMHDVESKSVRRRVWDDEEDKRYSISPPKGRSLPRSSSLHLPDHLLVANIDDFDESRLDSRHMVNNASRKEYPILRTEEKGRPLASNYSNGKLGRARASPVVKNYPKDKSVMNNTLIRKRPVSGRDTYNNKESTSKGGKVPVFQIKANFQAPGKGKPERVVTFMDKDGPRHWGGGDGSSNGNSAGQGRKRKASVWSRINLPGKGPGQKGAGTIGRGRVFSRLGPSTTNPSFEPRDDKYVHKNKKPRQQPQKIGVEVDPEILENVEDSPDALEGEDYLNDDLDASDGSEKEMEKAADDLQGWTRKKASVVNSGDESGNPDHGEYPNAKSGRRKLVRPSIGAKTQAGESGWKDLEPAKSLAGEVAENALAQRRSGSGSMDLEMGNAEAHEGEEGDSPLGSHPDLNSPARENRPDFQEDTMISS